MSMEGGIPLVGQAGRRELSQEEIELSQEEIRTVLLDTFAAHALPHVIEAYSGKMRNVGSNGDGVGMQEIAHTVVDMTYLIAAGMVQQRPEVLFAMERNAAIEQAMAEKMERESREALERASQQKPADQ